jgi:formylglycine-generating enzyme required for sulfatase activity
VSTTVFARAGRLILLTAAFCAALWAIERSTALIGARTAVRWGAGAAEAIAAAPATEVSRGRPVLSLVVAREDLYDPARGLLSNVLEHGDEWERPGTVAFFEDGEIRFATDVGVRVHGGGSRDVSERQGFRLYFRRRYGALQLPTGVLFGPDAQPIRTLVVHNDVRVDGNGDRWHLVNPVAYDIAAAMGAIAPATKPVRFFLNGEPQGLFVLTERIGPEFFEAHWGHGRVRADQAEFDTLWEWISPRRPLLMADVATRIDLDNLTRWFLSVAFCATRDAYQGPSQFRNLTRRDAQWFWVNWDMDGSFRVWDADSYSFLLEQVGGPRRGRNPAEPRATVVTRLLTDDPAYREYFAAMFDRVMNHRLTPTFLRERLDHYRRIATTLEPDETSFLDRLDLFLARRPAYFRRLTEQWLDTGPSQRIRISAPASVRVDGESVIGRFEGRYLPEREITLTAPEGDARFVEWRVNGVVAGRSTDLRLRTDAPADVEAIFAGLDTDPWTAAGGDNASVEPPAPAATPLRWVRIPAGRFQAGCIPDDPDCDGNERPQHPAEVSRSFEMLATEVTIGQFAVYARRSNLPMPRQPLWASSALLPVVNVTWDEAVAFCRAEGGRLPTEIEWEYAARGGVANRLFPWPGGFDGQANLGDDKGDDHFPLAAPVGSFALNGFGLADIIGNVWEWTADRYDPDAPSSAFDMRVVRGGSFMTGPRGARISERAELSRSGRHNLEVGFRCVRDPAGARR